jgi:hypothetical protein
MEAEGWTAEVMECFQLEVNQLVAGGNRKAGACALDLSESATLEEQQDRVMAWRSLATSICTLGRVTAQTPDLPRWQELSDLLDGWYAREGLPAPVARLLL